MYLCSEYFLNFIYLHWSKMGIDSATVRLKVKSLDHYATQMS